MSARYVATGHMIMWNSMIIESMYNRVTSDNMDVENFIS